MFQGYSVSELQENPRLSLLASGKSSFRVICVPLISFRVLLPCLLTQSGRAEPGFASVQGLGLLVAPRSSPSRPSFQCYWLLVAGLLVTGFWFLVSGCWFQGYRVSG